MSIMELRSLTPVLGRPFDGRRRAMRIDKWIWLSLGLGVLAILAVGTSHLALTDIYHADGDLSLEWNVLRVCFAVIVASQVAALVTLTKVLRHGIQSGAA
jgi:hypothetical protein